jgi:hypothetical protein
MSALRARVAACRGDRGEVPACRQGSARLLCSPRLYLSPYLCQDVVYLARLVVRLSRLAPPFHFPPCVISLPKGYPNPDEDKEGHATDTDGGGRLQYVRQSHKASQKQDEERSNADLSRDPTSLHLAFKLVTDLFQSRKHIFFVRHTPNPLSTTILRALAAANTKPKLGEINGRTRGHERRMHSTMIVAALIARAFALAPDIVSSIAIKSATVPIAVEIARLIQANPALTAIFVVVTGMIGAAFGPWLLDRARITHPLSRGLALGTISHGQGTAQAATESEFAGAVAGVAMGLGAICTSLAAPYLVPLLII